MRSIRIAATVMVAVLALASCSRDPKVVKQRYLDSGNKYFEKGRYKEARIKYKNALQKDMKFGPAYYRLGLTELKLNSYGPAILAFRRAKELIHEDQPEHWDAMVKASEILLLAGGGKKELMDEVNGYCEELFKHDPNSFDVHRLKGDLKFSQAIVNSRSVPKEETLKGLDDSIEEYRKADALKPRQVGVELQLARVLKAKGDYAGAEQLYRQVLEQDKTLQAPYAELYNLYVFQRKFAEGEQVLKMGFQNNPKQFEYLKELALHYFRMRRNTEMLGVLQQIKSHANEYQDAYIVVGDF